MKLDRHNYEEFFLLYVDNELTTEQKKSVEQFVQENPDLAMELEILQQTVLAADNSLVFTGKDSLLKNESGSLINMNNYEEYLISYIDHELAPIERKAFEKFAAAHPQVKEELSIYMQTKLQPEEEIVFANKEVLYRKEEKVRVISIQWWKIAVAAAVILAIGIGTISILNKNNTTTQGTEVAKTTEPVKKSDTNTTTTENKKQQSELKAETNLPEETIQDNVAAVTKDNATKIAADKKQQREKAQPKNSPSKNFTISNDEVLVKTETPAKKEKTIAAITDNNKAIDTDINKPAINENDLKSTIASVDKTASKQNTNDDAVTKDQENTYNNKETAQEDFNAVYASNNESKNKKLRGFFRKATRVFEKRTNISATDDTEEKILIGALAVKLK